MASSYLSPEDLLAKGIALFRNKFNGKPTIAAVAPGRVNLIGEHTDYNGGFVLPMALPLINMIIGRPICGNTAKVFTSCGSVDQPFEVELTVDQAKLNPEKPKWANYIRGVMALFPVPIPAFEAIVITTVPNGGGLSSSAALEVSMYTFLEALTKTKASSLIDKALVCQKAEHVFAKMPCGTMDQLVSAMAKKSNALLIDCRTNIPEYIPFDDPNVKIVITNSNVKHELTGSEYPLRKKQCVDAAALLQINSLREAKPDSIQKLQDLNAEPDIIKRAKHVISEIERTASAADALKMKDYIKFGKLMIESHNSLKMDYEVSCPELDDLVNIACEVDGVYGSRMTGGGFGGCTVTLVKTEKVDALIDNILKKYKKKPTIFICAAENGAHQLEIL